MTDLITPEEITALFTRADGQFLCARWGRPLSPIVFGVEDETLSVVKGAFEAVCAMSGHKMAETDPELGSNVMVFFFRQWDELLEVPDLDRLIEGLGPMVARLKEADANQYRVFRFDKDGSIKACFVFLRMDKELSALPAETLALSQVIQSMLVWSDQAFSKRSPLGKLENGHVVLRPEIAAVVKAAYAPELPPVSTDSSHAYRIFARLASNLPDS
ncbi:hypothetical protein [Tropicibacter naphthalenivorans]|uniref:Uncharacterized protein n=1 Tax=Tropicibacter naphthalenivorans TaxID=441103 RepID=A0A0P1GUA1_9RHOB|nr:hypothetical protein [Tropicibacter naphthalenivorans]CUH78703.1 hypothetical protein TRN7648_02120 [Tropicibacter naphthalenivorans]SMC81276.1 SpoU rRNA Methylase family enzyme [Tropicibacter naphthalenivorans]